MPMILGFALIGVLMLLVYGRLTLRYRRENEAYIRAQVGFDLYELNRQVALRKRMPSIAIMNLPSTQLSVNRDVR